MVDIIVNKKDEAFLKITGNDYAIRELSEHFTFKVPGYMFMPAYKNKMWDGNIRLLNTRSGLIYYGLLHYIEFFCKNKGYSIALSPELTNAEEFSVIEANNFIDTLNLPYKVRDYQLNSFIHAIRYNRSLILSPTGSGKSLIIYLIARYLQITCKKGLLVVPTLSLVSQMFKDFKDYGYNSDENCHMIYSGKDKNTDKFLTISTWQSIYNLNKKYFGQFDFTIGDEAHLYKAKSLTGILESCINSKYRIGTTGTLDGTHTHRLVLEGIFGPVYKATSTSDLIENKQLANFQVKCIILKYPEEVCKSMKKKEYSEEMDYIVTNEARNRFIRNLALSLENNTLILFQYVEKHGKKLYNMLVERGGDRKIFFVSGDVELEVREEIRSITEKEKDAIIVASYGTFSTGINIRNLHNIIAASPSKSRVRNLQSIGRVLRLSEEKLSAILFDISDDFRVGKHVNHTLKHFIERTKMYDEEKFTYRMYKIDLKQ